MEELYSGYNWVEHFDWQLSGTSEDLDLELSISCPKEALPLVALSLQLESKRGVEGQGIRFKEDFAQKLANVVTNGTISWLALSKITGIDEPTLKSIAEGSCDHDVDMRAAATLMIVVGNLLE